MKKSCILFFLLLLCTFSACGQTPESTQIHVGGPCEGCEAIYEYGDRNLISVDTLPGFDHNKPQLIITGTVFQKDERTPAENVIIYIYHTNREGVYETFSNETGWAERHGSYRGWVKTGPDGKYRFYTFRPASYPGTEIPEHIHMTVKEPTTNEYYIESIQFSDDPFLTESERSRLRQRGGSGIVTPRERRGMLHVNRNIILGENIPDYE